MLPELLLALSGVPGSIFVDKKSNGIQVVGDLPFLHSSEIVLLNRLCKLGTYYMTFEEFIRKCTDKSYTLDILSHAENNQVTGLYLKAFCSGLDQVLESYRGSLLVLEKQILVDPHLSLSHVQQCLEEYHLLFPALGNLIEQVKAQKAHGCKILELLFQNCSCGIPIVRQSIEKILFVCHGVFYKQLSAWLLHGILIDKYEEFFVIPAPDPQTEGGSTRTSDADQGGPGTSAAQQADAMEGSGIRTEKPGRCQYKLNGEMLPSYISTRLAEKILFIGESVKMFENTKHSKLENVASSVMRDKESEFTMALYQLQQRPLFSINSFEAQIDRMRSYIAEHLWKLVVEEADLLRHLMKIKEFYLLGRGEVFRTFIDKAKDLLRLPPGPNTSHDVNSVFVQVLHKLLPDDDENDFTLSVTVPEQKTAMSRKDSSAGILSSWSCVKMHHEVQWPIHILITPTVLEKYNTLFSFLLNVKRTQVELQGVWASHVGHKTGGRNQVINYMTKLHLLRMHMSFLVDNLQYYLQVDVLEAQFSHLMETIKNTHDFESIQHAHDTFLTTLLAQCFLLMKPVSHCLQEILSQCQSFCSLISQASENLTEREETQIENIAEVYMRQASLLFRILSSVRTHHSSPHLAQLLLRIDFNKQFTAGPFASLASGRLGAAISAPVNI